MAGARRGRFWRRFWPFERRGSSGYAELVVDRLISDALGSGSGRLAVTETAAGLVARAFAVGEIEGAPDAIRAALPPSVLYRIGRSLVATGESLHRIDVRAGRVRLLPCETWTVTGGADPDAWRYEATIAGPSTSTTFRQTTAAAVVHCRVPGDPSRPWSGRSPLATMERGLVVAVVRLFARRFGDPLAAGRILGVDEVPSKVAELREKFSDDPGRTAGIRARKLADGGMAWRLLDLKPELDPETVSMLDNARRELMRAAGIPDGLLGSESAGAAREAIRQVLTGAVQPLGELAAEELREKLDAPGLRLTFRRLGAADMFGKSRSFASLVKAGMPMETAARVAGIELPPDMELRAPVYASEADAALAVLARIHTESYR